MATAEAPRNVSTTTIPWNAIAALRTTPRDPQVVEGSGSPPPQGPLPKAVRSNAAWNVQALFRPSLVLIAQLGSTPPTAPIDPVDQFSTKALRLELVRKAASGERWNGPAISRQYTDLWLDLAQRGVTRVIDRSPHVDEIRQLVFGYPKFLKRETTAGKTYRIYCNTPELLEAIKRESTLLPAFYGYVEKMGPHTIDYPDLTGVFITTPKAVPAAIGVPDYRYYVDFEVPPEVGVIATNHAQIFVIPGPARIRDWMLTEAKAILAGTEPPNPAIADVVEIVKLVGDAIPEYRVPIRITGSGTLADPKKPAPLKP